MKKIKWYVVDKEYIKYLKQFDNKVENIDYKENVKPYIGIVLNVDKFNYYIPISSPKDKHYKMKESMDFIKVVDKKGKILGVLNINNMIPVLDSQVKLLKYSEIEKIRTFENINEKRLYVALLNLELKIINSRVEKIQNNALKLYELRCQNLNSKIAQRCCDFKLLEQKALCYKKG